VSDRDYAIGVCGFGRCGSTTVMTMLAAGGVPTWGAVPGYERDIDWNRVYNGTAIKLLDQPLRMPIPVAREWRFVWLDRDPIDQARSHLKILSLLGIGGGPDEEAWLIEGFKSDRPKLIAKLHAHGRLVRMRYERILENPRKAAKTLAGVWPGLDVDAASAVVHDRDGRCRNDIWELSQ
jgi:hypothetical protein